MVSNNCSKKNLEMQEEKSQIIPTFGYASGKFQEARKVYTMAIMVWQLRNYDGY